MTVETATLINQLDPTLPLGSDSRSEGDDHLRLIKSTLKATFPNVTAVVTPSASELNALVDVTSAVQAQLDSKAPIDGPDFLHDVTVGGTLVVAGVATAAICTDPSHLANKQYVDAAAFANSLPTQTNNDRRMITTDGSSASWASTFGAGIYRTTTTSAQTRQRYNISTAGSAWTLTLPSSPAVDDWVWIVDVAGACGSNNLTIARNGQNIMSLAEDLLVNLNSAAVLLIFNATTGWTISK